MAKASDRRRRNIEFPCKMQPGDRVTYSLDAKGNIQIVEFEPGAAQTGFNAFDREVLAGNLDALATMFEEELIEA